MLSIAPRDCNRQISEASLRETRPSGFVVKRRGRFQIDRRRKVASLIPNEIVLYELERFLAAGGPEPKGSVLDLGAGVKPYFPVYRNFFQSCVAVDVPESLHDTSGIDVFASADALPFEAESFDAIICTEVAEHCPDPRAVFREIARVLKPGGRAFVTTPFLVPLHEMPHDYYRYTPSALGQLARGAGLEILSLRPKGEYMAVMIDFAVRPIVKVWRRLSKLVRADLVRSENPLVFLTVVLPQLAYLAVWRRLRRREAGPTYDWYEKLSYATLGYVTVLVKS
jgi:SAM-dependent methyltransferase